MTAIFAIAGIVALIWGVVVLRFGGLLAGCLGVLLIGTCLGPPFFSYKLGPLPITADRVLLVSLTVIYGVAWLRGAVAKKPLGRPDVLLGLLLLTLATSALTHDWTIEGAQPLSNLAFYYVAPAAIYWLARQSPLNQRTLVMTFGTLGSLALYLGITSVAEAKQAWWLVYPKYIASPAFEEFFGRGRGPLLNPIGNGIYLVVGLACVSTFWPSARGGWENRLAVRAKQGAVLLAAVAILAGSYFTLTRSVWVAAGFVAAMIVGTRIPRSKRPSAAIAATLVGCSFLALNWERLQTFKRDQHVSAFEMSQSAGLRPVLANVAWKMFLDRPLLGCGLGQYKQVDGDYLRDPNSDLPLEKARPYNQHNSFLALLTETGLLGVGLFLATGLYWTVDAWKLWNCGDQSAHQLAVVYFAVLVAYLVNGMLHDVAVIPMVHMLLFALAGMCRGLVTSNEGSRSLSSFASSTRQLYPAT